MAKYQDTVTVVDGVKFTLCQPRKIKASERTFINRTGTLWKIGARNANLIAKNLKKGTA
jgi:hypothetical protein